jgi:hypothetical protein
MKKEVTFGRSSEHRVRAGVFEQLAPSLDSGQFRSGLQIHD